MFFREIKFALFFICFFSTNCFGVISAHKFSGPDDCDESSCQRKPSPQRTAISDQEIMRIRAAKLEAEIARARALAAREAFYRKERERADREKRKAQQRAFKLVQYAAERQRLMDLDDARERLASGSPIVHALSQEDLSTISYDPDQAYLRSVSRQRAAREVKIQILSDQASQKLGELNELREVRKTRPLSREEFSRFANLTAELSDLNKEIDRLQRESQQSPVDFNQNYEF